MKDVAEEDDDDGTSIAIGRRWLLKLLPSRSVVVAALAARCTKNSPCRSVISAKATQLMTCAHHGSSAACNNLPNQNSHQH
jgi:hypothetical protein